MEDKLKLDPQPEPPIRYPIILLTEPMTFTIVTPAAAYVIDKKTGKLKEVVPEMGDPKFYKNLAALEAGTAVLNATESIEGYEELRTLTAKMISSAAASVESWRKNKG